MEQPINPNLMIAGGAISADHARWFQFLDLQTPIVPAALCDEAGIVGVALFASRANRLSGDQRQLVP